MDKSSKQTNLQIKKENTIQTFNKLTEPNIQFRRTELFATSLSAQMQPILATYTPTVSLVGQGMWSCSCPYCSLVCTDNGSYVTPEATWIIGGCRELPTWSSPETAQGGESMDL